MTQPKYEQLLEAEVRNLKKERKQLRARVAELTKQRDDLLALVEARATFEVWKDVAPAVSLCADLDKAIASVKGGE